MKTWVKSGLFFALWMFVWMTFIVPYIFVWIGLQDKDESKFSIGKLVINAVVFTIAGLIFGYWNFKRKYKPKKQIDS